MDLKIVGAGLCRTGTTSLKHALERLLEAPCYHMHELFEHPEHAPAWQAAVEDGDYQEWTTVLDGYAAEVDLPPSLFWRELAAMNPDAPVLLSTRSSPDEWWRSTEATVVAAWRRTLTMPEGEKPPPVTMIDALLRGRLCSDPTDAEAMKAAYTAHNDAVRAAIAPDRLVEWQPGDGWQPLCDALGVPVPDEDFPKANTTDEFRSRAGLE